MKIIFFTTRLPYPINSGAKIVLSNWCQCLNEKYGYEIQLFSFTEEDQIYNGQYPDFISDITIAKQPGIIEKLYNLIIKSFLLRRWPLQVSLYYSKKTQKEFMKKIKIVNPDIVICDMIRTAEYIKGIKGSSVKILEMQDLLSVRYERQLEKCNLDSNVFGLYNKFLPSFLKKIVSSNFTVKNILKFEINILKKYEIKSNSLFDSIAFVSNVETNKFNRITQDKRGIHIPIGVDYEFYNKKFFIQKDDKLLCFTGNMDIAQNKDAADNFIINILPKIRKNYNDNIRFRIIGKCSYEYKKNMEKYCGVELTGEVEDIRPYVKQCCVFVAPLLYGSGVKTKILETMAMEIPIVTNSVGAEGIDIVGGKHLFICNDVDDFAEKVILLLNDEKLNFEIALNAKEYIKTNGQWINSLKKLDEKIKDVSEEKLAYIK